MDRLTKHFEDKYSLGHENCPLRGQCYDGTDCVDVLLDRLGKYENAIETGELRHIIKCDKCVMHNNCITEDAFTLAGLAASEAFCCAAKLHETEENKK